VNYSRGALIFSQE
jgi:hypothetical protein